MSNNSVQNIEFSIQNFFKKTGVQLANFLIDSNLIIAVGATLLALESLVLLSAETISVWTLLIVFFSTMTIYHLAELKFHFDLESKLRIIFTSTEDAAFHKSVLIFSCIFLVGLTLFLHLSAILFLMLLALVSFTYGFINLRDSNFSIRTLPIVKNILLAMMWAMATVIFPVLAEGISILNLATGFVFIERFLFILVLSFMFDLRDFYSDPKEGLKTIATITGYKKLKSISQLLLAALIAIIIIHFTFVDQANNLLSVAIALILSVLITSFFIFITNKSKSKNHYSLLFDGATVIQAILVLMLSLLVVN